MNKAALSLILLLLLAAPLVLPPDDYCSDEDGSCDTPCTDCLYHCTCSIGFSALPADIIDFSVLARYDQADQAIPATQLAPGYVSLPDLPPRTA